MRGFRSAGAATLRAVPTIARDLVGVAGAGAIVHGVWQMYRPAAWIVAGAIMVAIALRLAAARRTPADHQ